MNILCPEKSFMRGNSEFAVGGRGGGGLRNMLRWPWVTLAGTRRGGGGVRS